MTMIGWFQTYNVQPFQPIIKGVILVIYPHWGCIFIYRPLSYALKFLPFFLHKHNNGQTDKHIGIE